MKPEIDLHGAYDYGFGINSMCGRVGAGHPHLPEGEYVTTSEILRRFTEGDYDFIETRNTVYRLVD